METIQTVMGRAIQVCGILYGAMLALLLLVFLIREGSKYIVKKEAGVDRLLKVMTYIGGYGFYGFIGLACLYALIAGIASALK